MKVFVFSFSFLLACVSFSHAESFRPLDEVKQKVTSRFMDNQQLKAETKRLQQELVEWQAKILQQEQSMETFAREKEEELVSVQMWLNTAPELKDQTQKMDHGIALRETQIAFLQGLLLDFQDQERIWKLKLADLLYEQQQIELELREKELLLAAIQENERARVNANLKEANQLAIQKSGLETSFIQTRQEIQLLHQQGIIFETENRTIGHQIQLLTEDMKKVQAQIDELKEKKSKDEADWEKQLAQRASQQQNMQSKIDQIRTNLEELESKQEEHLARLRNKNKLANQIAALSEENQLLQSKIENLSDLLEVIE